LFVAGAQLLNAPQTAGDDRQTPSRSVEAVTIFLAFWIESFTVSTGIGKILASLFTRSRSNDKPDHSAKSNSCQGALPKIV
jgi:hypothetical protein